MCAVPSCSQILGVILFVPTKWDPFFEVCSSVLKPKTSGSGNIPSLQPVFDAGNFLENSGILRGSEIIQYTVLVADFLASGVADPTGRPGLGEFAPMVPKNLLVEKPPE